MKFKKTLLIFFQIFILVSCSRSIDYKGYEHYQTLDFSYFGYGLNILKSPFKKDILYTVKKGDKIKVTEFRVYKNDDCYIKVITPSGKTGFIPFGKNNVYKNDREEFKQIDTIEVNNKSVWVLSFNKTLGVYSDFLYSLPDFKSEKIYELSKSDKENYAKTIAITNDFEWIKFTISGVSGWVPKDCVYVDRGGLAYWTPAVSIQYELIDKYLPGEL